MQITFKLYATLMDRLPPEASDHALTLDVTDTTSAQDLIERFGIAPEEAHLVLVNGIYFDAEQRKAALKPADTVAIWPPIAGG